MLRAAPPSSFSRSVSIKPCIVVIAVAAFLGAAQGMAQEREQGEALIAVHAFQESDTAGFRDNLAGTHLEFHQLLHNHGVFNLVADVNGGHGALFGRNYVEWLGLPWRNRRVSLTVGDFFVPLDRGPLRFSNLYVPYLYAAGGALAVNSERWNFYFFGGRNRQPFGPRIQALHSLPDTVAGAQATFKWKPNVQFESRYLHTRALTPAEIAGQPDSFLEFRAPRRSDNIYVDAYYDPMPHVTLTAEVAASNFTPQPQHRSDFPQRNFVSYVFGSAVTRDRFQLEANVVHQGQTYLPLSNALLGDRHGQFVTAAYRPLARLRFSGSEAGFHNNLEGIPSLPVVKASDQQATIGLLPAAGWTLNLTASHGRLAEPDRVETLNSYRGELYKNYGSYQTSASWQLFDIGSRPQSTASTRFHALSVDQRKAFHNGDMIFAGVTFQHGVFPGRSADNVSVRVGGYVRLFRILSAHGQAEFGHDLANETLFTTSHLRTTVAGLSLSLPRSFSLQGDLLINSLRTEINTQSTFFAETAAGAPVLPLLAFSHRLYFLELRKELRWGRSRGLPLGASQEVLEPMIPAYGVVEGYAFNDRNGNGLRDPGEEGLPSVQVSVSGRMAVTDADGNFRIADVRTGPQTLIVDLDHLPAFYNPPAQVELPIQVRQQGNALVSIPLQVVGSIAGRVEVATAKGEFTGYEGAQLVLSPGNSTTTTDEKGNYRFDNLLPGEYDLQIKAESLSEFAKVIPPETQHVSLPSGGHRRQVDFQFRVEAPERPVEKIVQPPQKIVIPPARPSSPPSEHRLPTKN